MPNNNADIVSNFNINRVGENVSSFILLNMLVSILQMEMPCFTKTQQIQMVQ
jgi:hypothetical protein